MDYSQEIGKEGIFSEGNKSQSICINLTLLIIILPGLYFLPAWFIKTEEVCQPPPAVVFLSVPLGFLRFLLYVFHYDDIWQITILYLREKYFPLKTCIPL